METASQTPDLVSRAEVFALLTQFKELLAADRRRFLVDGRAIEAAACSIQIAAAQSAINLVKTAQRRG